MEERQETDGERQARVTERHTRDGHERQNKVGICGNGRIGREVAAKGVG